MAELRDRDSAELAFRLRIFLWVVPTATIMAAAVAMLLHVTRGISGLVMLGIILAGAASGATIAVIATWASSHASRGLVQMLTGAGNLTPAPSFSEAEALTAQGRHQDAVDVLRLHLARHPDDHAARLALVPILAGPLGDPTGAAAILIEIRRMSADPAVGWRVAQELIDLYRAAGNRGGLMGELARLSHAHPGTRAARSAAAELAALKQESPPPG